ncbi:uncharacterized protein LOC127834795 [Dreissena polymorpha]|uniref:Mab-21-like nucleotidyltransferase domain-containing protein n=1 Tax=Dreissena polymorpha TaxID=45954 RepID=A0A9D4GBF2_DREPO|nr:uncharacterized protein LOC127834795 [Dreissena polymorpha]KAH3812321.1 hypothetical protein DPMN_140750 [Dreissena polymorpha]
MLASQTESYMDTNPLDLLLYASSEGDLQQVTEILETGIDVNSVNEIGQTALLAASIANKTDTCALLLQKGAKLDHSDIGGYTALHLTTDADLTKLLLFNINDDKKKEFVNARTNDNITPLHEAAIRGSPGKVLELLSNHADVNAEDENRSTPLHYAVARSGTIDTSFMEALIESGADVNKQNVSGQTPLAIACKQHQFMRNEITVLLKAGADPLIQANDGNTALHVLFFGTNLFEPTLTVELVEELVESNKKCLETVNLYGELPLHVALSKPFNEEIALLLLKHDPDMSNSKDDLGRTLLHLACEKDYLLIIDKYIESPTLVNATDFLGRSILHYSCMYSQSGESVKRIFESQAFQICGLTDLFGITAYQYAASRNSEVMNKLKVHFEDHIKTTACARCVAGRSICIIYEMGLLGEKSEKLSSLLPQMVVGGNITVPSSLRPLKNAEDYVSQMWRACESPVKNSASFELQKRKVENFMITLIGVMKEYDGRFEGNLRMRGSAYEGTIADERGDFDFMLDIDNLSSICSAKEGNSDPPGFVRVALDMGKDPGIYKDFFDSDGMLRSERILSKFSLAVMYALHQPSLWRTCGFDFFPKLCITWKDRPALSIKCRMFHQDMFFATSIDFLPAIHCEEWWPAGFDCNGFLDQRILKLGCQLILKPPDVPYYQHAKFGNPRQYLKMSFSEAETTIFQRSHANIKQAFIIAKLFLDRNIKLPWRFIEPESDEGHFLYNSQINVQTKNLLTSFMLKQSLLNELKKRQFASDREGADSVLVWVQRIYAGLHTSLKEGCLPSIFLPNLNYMHTFQPDSSIENMRNLVLQIIYHSLLEEDMPLDIDRNVSWHRGATEFLRSMHSRFSYLHKILQSPEEWE